MCWKCWSVIVCACCYKQMNWYMHIQVTLWGNLFFSFCFFCFFVFTIHSLFIISFHYLFQFFISLFQYWFIFLRTYPASYARKRVGVNTHLQYTQLPAYANTDATTLANRMIFNHLFHYLFRIYPFPYYFPISFFLPYYSLNSSNFSY